MTRQKDGALTDTTLPPKDPPSMCNKSTSTVKKKKKKALKRFVEEKRKDKKINKRSGQQRQLKTKKCGKSIKQVTSQPFFCTSVVNEQNSMTLAVHWGAQFKKNKKHKQVLQQLKSADTNSGRFSKKFQADSRLFFINAALRPRKTYGLLGTRGPGWPPRLPRISWAQVRVQCCFTSTEAVRTIGDGEPGRPTRLSPSSWALLLLCCLMSSDVGWHIRDKLRPSMCFTSTETVRFVRTESPGRPPRLSHSSWALL